MSTTPEDRIRAQYKALVPAVRRMYGPCDCCGEWLNDGDRARFNEEKGKLWLALAQQWKRPVWEIKAIVKRTGMYHPKVLAETS